MDKRNGYNQYMNNLAMQELRGLSEFNMLHVLSITSAPLNPVRIKWIRFCHLKSELLIDRGKRAMILQ